MKVHFCSAHFGSRPPSQQLALSKKFDLTTAFYTDNNTASRSLSMHPRLKGKIPKMLEHRFHEADWYVWMDSTFKIKDEFFIDRLLDLRENVQILLYNHPDRKSIKEESDLIEKMMANGDRYMIKRYSGEPIKEQVDYYLSDQNFSDNKLFAMGFFAYHKSVVEVFEEWFLQNTLWSIQDQISFPYVMYKFNPSYKLISDGDIFQNSFVSHKHGQSKNYFERMKDSLKRRLTF